MEIISHNTLNFGQIKTTVLESLYITAINPDSNIVSVTSFAEGAQSSLSYYNDIIRLIDDPKLQIPVIQNKNE